MTTYSTTLRIKPRHRPRKHFARHSYASICRRLRDDQEAEKVMQAIEQATCGTCKGSGQTYTRAVWNEAIGKHEFVQTPAEKDDPYASNCGRCHGAGVMEAGK